MNKWTWEVTTTARNGAAGDLAKLFRNEEIKQPGVFSADPPSNDATIVAREVIQNSWDAAREMQSLCRAAGMPIPDFSIQFRFRELVGTAKESLVANLDLRGLREKFTVVGDSRQLGIGNVHVLEELDNDTPIRVLEIIESGTTGMYGPFSSPSSKMYLAMLSIGYTKKDVGAGGSYGYGKAGLIRASTLHSVVAYTNFLPQKLEPTVTRRALGVTYWGQHDANGEVYTGFARLGDETSDGTIPLIDEAADEFALCLGLDKREPDGHSTGTTFLLVSPGIAAPDLCRAIERNWWPAIMDGLMDVSVTDFDGSVMHPRPKKDPVLAPFIRAFEIALTNQDNIVEGEKRIRLQSTHIPDVGLCEVGSIGLIANVSDWSYEDDVHDSHGEVTDKHRSLVALVRSPRMIVEYRPITDAKPHVRGVFIASDEIDDLLRQTEPKTHSSWQPSGMDEDVSRSAAHAADYVLRSIRHHLMTWRRSIKPRISQRDRVRLRELENQLKRLFSGDIPIVPPSPPRKVSIGLDQDLSTTKDGQIQIVGSADLNLNDNFDKRNGNTANVRVEIACTVLEEGGVGLRLPLAVKTPKGFVESDASGTTRIFVGELGFDRSAFKFKSDSYLPDWTARITVSAEIVADEASLAASEVRRG